MRVFENMVLRRIFGLRGRKGQKDGTKYRKKSFVLCSHHLMMLI
jgi:hypothetical protein